MAAPFYTEESLNTPNPGELQESPGQYGVGESLLEQKSDPDWYKHSPGWNITTLEGTRSLPVVKVENLPPATQSIKREVACQATTDVTAIKEESCNAIKLLEELFKEYVEPLDDDYSIFSSTTHHAPDIPSATNETTSMPITDTLEVREVSTLKRITIPPPPLHLSTQYDAGLKL